MTRKNNVTVRPDRGPEYRARLMALRRNSGSVETHATQLLSIARARAQKGTFEQRSAARSALLGVRETRPCRLAAPNLDWEVRDIANGTGGSDMLFTGFACVTGVEYEMEDKFGPYGELVTEPAFDRTLSRNADVSFLVNHEGMTLARTKSGTMKLSAVKQGSPTGLHVEARLDMSNTTVREIRSAIERGDLDEMSMAFRISRQEWSEDFTRRTIQEVNMSMGDVSVVNYAANPFTAGTVGVRGKRLDGPVALRPDRSRHYRRVLADLRKS
jgi:HK97 family phage prohead protease